MRSKHGRLPEHAFHTYLLANATKPKTAPMPARALFPDFDTSYAQLPPSFYSYVEPYGASAPSLIKLNTALAETLG